VILWDIEGAKSEDAIDGQYRLNEPVFSSDSQLLVAHSDSLASYQLSSGELVKQTSLEFEFPVNSLSYLL